METLSKKTWTIEGRLQIVSHPKFGEVCANCSGLLISESIDDISRIGRDWYCGTCDEWRSEWLKVERSKEYVEQYFKRSMNTYTLDDVRKTYPRAYLKWSDEEVICSVITINDGKTDEELMNIFGRQLSITRAGANGRSFRLKIKPMEISDVPAKLGNVIKCMACGHETLFTFMFLEMLAEKAGFPLLEISEKQLNKGLRQYCRCQECKKKQATLQ